MGDSLSKVEKNLKALAKRYESVRYSKGLAILFLMLGVNAFSEENVEDHNQNQNTTDTDRNKDENSTEAVSKVQIKSTAAKLKERLEQIKKENKKNLSSEKLELIKLMEQGDQVVKSPWSSWQFGANTFQDFSVGKYKGHGDKQEKYKHSGIIERDTDKIISSVSPLSKNKGNYFSKISAILDRKSYGLENLKLIAPPIIDFKIEPSISLREPKEFKQITPEVKTDSQKTPRTFIFETAIPKPLIVSPMEVNIKTIELNAYFNKTRNAVYPTHSTNSPREKTYIEIPIGEYNLNQGDTKNGELVHTIIDIEENPGQYVTAPKGTIFNVNSIGDRAFSMDTNAGWRYWVAPGGTEPVFESAMINKGTVNLNVEKTAAFDIQTDTTRGEDPNHPGDKDYVTGKKLYGINKGQIIGHADNQVAMTLTREQEPGVEEHVFKNEEDGTITMNGNGSMAFSYSVQGLHVETYNKGKINLNGKNSYAFAFGKYRDSYFGKEGHIVNEMEGIVDINGDNSGAFAFQEMLGNWYKKADGKWDMDSDGSYFLQDVSSNIIIENKGKININSNNSFGLYSEQLKIENKGEININENSEKSIGLYAKSNEEKIKLDGYPVKRKNFKISELVNNGTINIKSEKSDNIGLYTGNAKVINDVDGRVNITKGENVGMIVEGTGVGENKGLIKTISDGSIGILTKGTGRIINTGTVEVSGNETENKGTVGVLAEMGSTISSEDGRVNIDVKGKNSLGVYSTGTISLGEGQINASERAINLFANDSGKIEIATGKTLNTTTATGSVLFYTGDNGTGKINLTGNLKATIKGGDGPDKKGTAFYYKSTVTPTAGSVVGYNDSLNYGTFTIAQIQKFFDTSFGTGTLGSSTLGNLELKMEENSRLFISPNVKLNLSEAIGQNLFGNVQGAPTFSSDSSEKYSANLLFKSELKIDEAVNLDNNGDTYKNLEISNSSIINENSVTGTKANQVFIAQENGDTNKAYVTLVNETGKNINLSGAESLAIYGKNGYIINKGNIEMAGDSATAIYGTGLSTIKNESSAKIILKGKKSLGLYYKNTSGGVTEEKLKNEGSIELLGDKQVAMTYEPNELHSSLSSGTENLFLNEGEIKISGNNSVAMYAKKDKNDIGYFTLNKGKIISGVPARKSSVGMYTDAEKNKLINELDGKIETSDLGNGIFGYDIENKGKIKVNKDGIGIYSKGGNVNLSSGSIDLEDGTKSEGTTGVILKGSSQVFTKNNVAKINLKNHTYGIVDIGEGNTINSNGSSSILGNNSTYIYSKDSTGVVNNSTNIDSNGNTGENFGIYSNGTVNNSGRINLIKGYGNVAIYSYGGTSTNSGEINVADSDVAKKLYNMGMVAGYTEGHSPVTETISTIIPKYTGSIVNTGNINVNGKNGIGMYATGNGSSATNTGNIVLNADGAIGIYADEGAVVNNSGTIKTGKNDLQRVHGLILGVGATLNNTGTININSVGGVGVRLKGGTIANYGTIIVDGDGAEKVVEGSDINTDLNFGGIEINFPKGEEEAIIKEHGRVVEPLVINYIGMDKPKKVLANSIGMYVDTSGYSFTKPIENIGILAKNADLIIGTEATKRTTSKYIEIKDPKILEPYMKSMLNNPQVTNWSIYSGGLTWMATSALNKLTGIPEKIYLAKIPYTVFAGDKKTTRDTYNFLDGLEQKYGVEALGAKERKLFEKLNSIGNNEEILFHQAVDEMMGHQYANTQQRVKETSDVLDKEFNYLRKDWQNFSKDSNKIKTFATHGKYETNTAGVIDYTNNAYGVAYVHEDETVRLGKTTGWYAGIVDNKFNFKDIGNSKEEQLQGKIGVFKSIPFDYDNSLNLTISGDLSVGYNKMNRRFLVVDEIFGAKAKYYTYAAGLKNELSKEIRLSEDFSFKPYAQARVEYGKISKIKEKSGEMKLEVKANDYYSIKPEAGAELIFKYSFGSYKTVKAVLSAAYENELGKIADGRNQAKVADTSADYFNIRGEKENREGNIKTDLKVGVDNSRVGLTANVGYDTKGQNIRGGVGVRFIF